MAIYRRTAPGPAVERFVSRGDELAEVVRRADGLGLLSAYN
jgi:hypothetical protein